MSNQTGTEELSSVTDTEQTTENPDVDSNNSISIDTNERKEDKQKVDILLKPTGNAPIMKKKKWAVDADKQIGWIMEFIKKYLKLEQDEKLVKKNGNGKFIAKEFISWHKHQNRNICSARKLHGSNGISSHSSYPGQEFQEIGIGPNSDFVFISRRDLNSEHI